MFEIKTIDYVPVIESIVIALAADYQGLIFDLRLIIIVNFYVHVFRKSNVIMFS